MILGPGGVTSPSCRWLLPKLPEPDPPTLRLFDLRTVKGQTDKPICPTLAPAKEAPEAGCLNLAEPGSQEPGTGCKESILPKKPQPLPRSHTRPSVRPRPRMFVRNRGSITPVS